MKRTSGKTANESCKLKITWLSTSSFAVPSYSIRTDKLYVRQEDTGDPRYGERTVFDAGGVLRQWDHATTRHAGETMPQTCRRALAGA